MICYQDRTFCISPNCVNKCGRKLTNEIKIAADKWWGEGEGKAPIAVSCFCGGDLKDVIKNMGKTERL